MKTVLHGILLKKINYGENGLILHFFTLEKGFLAFIFQGGKKKKGNILFPLSLIEITAYLRNDNELGKIHEVVPTFIPQTLYFHPVKSGLLFFMSEILSQLLANNGEDSFIYQFVEEEIKWLDKNNDLTNYPIWFLLKIAEIIGVGIHVIDKDGTVFNMEEGNIIREVSAEKPTEEKKAIAFLSLLADEDKEIVLNRKLPKKQRRIMLQQLLDYMQYHVNGFRRVKSIEILQTVLE